MTFGQRLKKLMADKDITYRQLSQELKIAVSTLSGYTNDHREPDFMTLIQLANYFNVSTDYLLDFTPAYQTGDLKMDPEAQRLLYYYQTLTPEFKRLLLDQAELLQKHNLMIGNGPENQTCRQTDIDTTEQSDTKTPKKITPKKNGST